MNDVRKETIRILGDVDLNLAIHNLIGHWYATKPSDGFNVEQACDMIDYMLKDLPNPVGSK
jgi:hypothetical protein